MFIMAMQAQHSPALPGIESLLEKLPFSIILLQDGGRMHYANLAARRLAAVVHSDPDEGLARLIADAPLQSGPVDNEGFDDAREDRFECPDENGNALSVIRQWRTCMDSDMLSVTIRPARLDRSAALDPEQPETHARQQDPNLLQKQSMIHAEKLATVGQLAAGMAHEINNPICYVQSNLGTLRDYLNKLLGLMELSDELLRDGSTPDEQRRQILETRKQAADFSLILEDLPSLLEESREGVERIRQIVQNLRDFSRMDPTESFRLFDLHRAIETTLSMVRSLGGGGMRFVTSFESLPLVECNPTELNQVFMNILVNATQAVVSDGLIEIRTGSADQHVWIEIKDNGCGIDENTLNRIFEPFFTTKEVGRGTGLGLSISYGIIKKHGGDIVVQSTVGTGTTFLITLPIKQKSQDKAPAQA